MRGVRSTAAAVWPQLKHGFFHSLHGCAHLARLWVWASDLPRPTSIRLPPPPPHPRLQAELGVGDCGGLRLIPGMTKSGVQKRPEWMNNLFGMEAQE